MKNFIVLTVYLLSTITMAQQLEFNSDESKVPHYELPSILTTQAGKTVKNVKDWEKTRRPEILELFAEHVYGHTPTTTLPISFKVLNTDEEAIGGKAIKREILIDVANGKHPITMLLYLPKSKKPVPVFIGLNFFGNHSIQPDPSIALASYWVENKKEWGITNHQANETSRGKEIRRWPVEAIVSRGYGVATVFCGDLDPDFDDGFQNGIQPLFYAKQQTKPLPNEWGTIGAWAWGLSRMMDYLETDPAVNPKQVIVTGHSRLGKAAIWAGVQDKRFAMVVSNDSGEGGAAITRRKFGETIKHINTFFPHWFSTNYKKYKDNEDALPVDYHQLLSLVAPRPLYVASASEDLWADPRGEYLSAFYASELYRLYGLKALTDINQPEPEKPILDGYIGHHIRKGKHEMLEYDWQQYMNFADKHFK